MAVEVKTQAEFEAALKNGGDIRLRGSAEFWLTACDNATVRAYNNATVRAYNNATVTACDNATVTACDNATVTASGNATVTACDNATVTADDNATVTAFANVIVRLFGALSVTASASVVIVRHGKAQKQKGGRTLDAGKPRTVKQWCAHHGVETKSGVAIVYKALDADFKSPHGTSYAPGTKPIAPDWDKGQRECGGGLHFSPTPWMALRFHGGAKKFAACPVKLSDIRKPTATDEYPDKIKARGCCAPTYEVDLDGKPIKAA